MEMQLRRFLVWFALVGCPVSRGPIRCNTWHRETNADREKDTGAAWAVKIFPRVSLCVLPHVITKSCQGRRNVLMVRAGTRLGRSGAVCLKSGGLHDGVNTEILRLLASDDGRMRSHWKAVLNCKHVIRRTVPLSCPILGSSETSITSSRPISIFNRTLLQRSAGHQTWCVASCSFQRRWSLCVWHFRFRVSEWVK